MEALAAPQAQARAAQVIAARVKQPPLPSPLGQPAGGDTLGAGALVGVGDGAAEGRGRQGGAPDSEAAQLMRSSAAPVAARRSLAALSERPALLSSCALSTPAAPAGQLCSHLAAFVAREEKLIDSRYSSEEEALPPPPWWPPSALQARPPGLGRPAAARAGSTRRGRRSCGRAPAAPARRRLGAGREEERATTAAMMMSRARGKKQSGRMHAGGMGWAERRRAVPRCAAPAALPPLSPLLN